MEWRTEVSYADLRASTVVRALKAEMKLPASVLSVKLIEDDFQVFLFFLGCLIKYHSLTQVSERKVD